MKPYTFIVLGMLTTAAGLALTVAGALASNGPPQIGATTGNGMLVTGGAAHGGVRRLEGEQIQEFLDVTHGVPSQSPTQTAVWITSLKRVVFYTEFTGGVVRDPLVKIVQCADIQTVTTVPATAAMFPGLRDGFTTTIWYRDCASPEARSELQITHVGRSPEWLRVLRTTCEPSQ